MKLNRSRHGMAALGLCAVVACGGGGGGGGGMGWLPAAPPAPSEPGAGVSVQGRVLDASTGSPLEGFEVQLGGVSARTGGDGAFAFTLDQAPAEATVVARRAGFRTQARTLPLVAGTSSTQDLSVHSLVHEEHFTAERGVMAWVGDGTVDIAANAVVDAAGQAYRGEVLLRASFGNPTTVSGNDAQPQPSMGHDGEQLSSLQTLGTIEFDLRDPTGAPLGLRERAGLSYPGLSAIDRRAAEWPGWRYTDDGWRRVPGARRLADGSWEPSDGAQRLQDGSYRLNVEQPGLYQVALPLRGPAASASVRTCVRFAEAEVARAGVALVLTGPGFQRRLMLPSASAPAMQVEGLPIEQPLQAVFLDAGSGRQTVVEVPALSPGATHVLPCVSLVGTAMPAAAPAEPVPLPVLVPDPVVPLRIGGALRVGGRSPAGAVHGVLCANTGDDGRMEMNGTLNVAGVPRTVSLVGESHTGRYYRLRDDSATPGPLVLHGRVRLDWWWASYGGFWEWFSAPDARSADTTGTFWTDDQVFPGDPDC